MTYLWPDLREENKRDQNNKHNETSEVCEGKENDPTPDEVRAHVVGGLITFDVKATNATVATAVIRKLFNQ